MRDVRNKMQRNTIDKIMTIETVFTTIFFRMLDVSLIPLIFPEYSLGNVRAATRPIPLY